MQVLTEGCARMGNRGRVLVEGTFGEFNRGDGRARQVALEHARNVWRFSQPSINSEGGIIPKGQKGPTPLAGNPMPARRYLSSKSDQEILDLDVVNDPGLKKIAAEAAKRGHDGTGTTSGPMVQEIIVIDRRDI